MIFEPFEPRVKSVGLNLIGDDPTVATIYVSTTTDKGFTNNNNFIPLTDYLVTFGPGEILKSVPIQILYNAQADGDRKFGIVAKDDKGRMLAKGSFTVVDNQSTD